MTGTVLRLQRALHELRRRHVIRVVGAYIFCVWVVLQGASIVFPPLLVPGWVLTVLVILAIGGLPTIAILTWVYDITPAGLVRTPSVPADTPDPPPLNWRAVDLVIILALLITLTFVLVNPDNEPEISPGISIAVLPFADLSPDSENGYFCDGLSEALIDSLARLKGLRVISRTSSFAFRNESADIRSLAAKLGADSILEGSVRMDHNNVRVSARLVDGRLGHNLWSETYSGTLDNVFLLQENIARAIAEVLQIELLSDQNLVEVATSDEDAYDHYLRGRASLRREGTLKNVIDAIEHFEQAMQLDRHFALAQAGLCTALWQQYELTRDVDLVPTALVACQRAELINDQRAETYVAMGHIHLGTGESERALTAFNRAAQLDPDHSAPQLGLAMVMEVIGHSEKAEVFYRRAIDRDPGYWRNYSALGAFLAGTGRLDEAIATTRTAISLQPDSPRLYSNLGGFLLFSGDHAAAAEAFRESIARHPTAPAFSNAGTALYFDQEYEQAEQMFIRAVELGPADFRLHAHLADAILMQPGRTEEANGHYRRAIELARRQLDVNPTDHDTRALLTTFLARTGEPELAAFEIELLQRESQLSREAHWSLGEALVMLHNTTDALQHFDQARALGLPDFYLKNSQTLQSMIDNPDFQPLMAAIFEQHESRKTRTITAGADGEIVQ